MLFFYHGSLSISMNLLITAPVSPSCTHRTEAISLGRKQQHLLIYALSQKHTMPSATLKVSTSVTSVWKGQFCSDVDLQVDLLSSVSQVGPKFPSSSSSASSKMTCAVSTTLEIRSRRPCISGGSKGRGKITSTKNDKARFVGASSCDGGGGDGDDDPVVFRFDSKRVETPMVQTLDIAIGGSKEKGRWPILSSFPIRCEINQDVFASAGETETFVVSVLLQVHKSDVPAIIGKGSTFLGRSTVIS